MMLETESTEQFLATTIFPNVFDAAVAHMKMVSKMMISGAPQTLIDEENKIGEHLLTNLRAHYEMLQKEAPELAANYTSPDDYKAFCHAYVIPDITEFKGMWLTRKRQN